MSQFSIGVVTYINRFETYFKPLVRQLDLLFPGVQKNYVLNGYYDQAKQQDYLEQAKAFLKSTSADNIITFNEHHGLTHCWNQLLISSRATKVLILNDDLIINRLFSWSLKLQIDFFETAVINRSWSHFIISKTTARQVGWFDERFVGMGSEDADYALRMSLAEGKTTMTHNYIKTIYCLGVKNVVARDTDPGWKKISEFSQGKYAKVNFEFFLKKWDIIKEPKPGYVQAFNGDYFGIRPGMDTPMFYPLSLLD